MFTTLNKIRAYAPCASGWETLLTNLGKIRADDEPLAITAILDSNGLIDALWCLRAVDNYDREIRLYAVWCARQVQHLMTDPRSLAAIDVAERYACGHATEGDLRKARDAAVVARDAAKDAWIAARAAARAVRAVRAVRAAAWAAAWAAARDSAWAAAEDAAEDAARDAQEKKLREVCAEIAMRKDQ